MATIMVVDDEPALQQLVQFILEKDGHEVWTANNGVEAVDRLGLQPRRPDAPLPDLMVLDVMMPIMDGYAVALRMNDDARASKVPILVVTAKGDMRMVFEKLPNVAAFFAKPFDPRALREAVGRALRKIS